MNLRWKPHDAQIAIASPLLSGEVTDVFAQCGRNLGKTDLVAYLLWRWALAFPGSENYYFSPFMKQSREIIWASRRLQNMGPDSELQDTNNSEMRLIFNNESFIKCDGSDNVDAYRGVKPRGLTVFDEFKDFRPEFYEAYDPNRAAHQSPLLIIGTPPDNENQFIHVAEEFRRNPDKLFFQFPSSANPHLSKKWLEDKKKELYLRGDGDVWEREYEARFVRGGASKVFPMLKDSHRKPHDEVLRIIHRDRRKLQWFVWADPAAASVFAVLFAVLNPYTKTWYFLDEIYETNQGEMTVMRIGKRIQELKHTIIDHPAIEWRQGYDEAEKWFASEMFDHFQEHFEPTHKMKTDKVRGLTLIKDALLHDHIVISDRCKKLFWEMDSYRKDKNGNIPKENDHLLDCVRYLFAAANYSLSPEAEPKENPEIKPWYKIEDDFPHMKEGVGFDDEWGIE